MSDTSATCPRCQGAIHPQTLVCPHCGSDVTAPHPTAAPGPVADAAGQGERRVPDTGPSGPQEIWGNQPTLSGESDEAAVQTANRGTDDGPGQGPADETTDVALHDPDGGAGYDATPVARPQPFSLWQQLRETLATLDAAMAWNEVWFFLMWGFLFLTYFLT
ncbi:MAG: hypothetical protein GX442_19220 [Candidatus Riflebacteria bacterium]|nr:hypothetical protein [Candidatus Riflebacteria bacterium]